MKERMSIRLPVLLSTLEHVQLIFETNKKHFVANIKLDTKNLTRDEITVLREVLELPPLEEWYPRLMREIVVWERFIPLTKMHEVAPAKREFEAIFQRVLNQPLLEEWWTDKTNRPKQNSKHAKEWAADVLQSISERVAEKQNV